MVLGLGLGMGGGGGRGEGKYLTSHGTPPLAALPGHVTR